MELLRPHDCSPAVVARPIPVERRFGFTRLLLRLGIETDSADVDRARGLADRAGQTCLVSASLDVPVETVIEVRDRSGT